MGRGFVTASLDGFQTNLELFLDTRLRKFEPAKTLKRPPFITTRSPLSTTSTYYYSRQL